jgi:heme/copper-type cytochrome/quinol oxidase subunit 4
MSYFLYSELAAPQSAYTRNMPHVIPLILSISAQHSTYTQNKLHYIPFILSISLTLFPAFLMQAHFLDVFPMGMSLRGMI